MASLAELTAKAQELALQIKDYPKNHFDADRGWESSEAEGIFEQLNADYDDTQRQIAAKRTAADIQAKVERINAQAEGRTMLVPIGQREVKIPQDAVSHAVLGWLRVGDGRRPSDTQIDCAEYTGINLRSPYIDVPFGAGLAPRAAAAREVGQTNRRRVMNDLTTATSGDAGHTVPVETLARVLEVALLASGPMMVLPDIYRTTSGETLRLPTMDNTSNKAVIVGEAADATTTEETPSFGDLSLGAYKYKSFILASQELLEDSVFNMSTVIGQAMGEQFGRALNEHFTVGTGSSQPNGIVTAATSAGTTPGAIDADTLFEVFHSVDPSYRDGARWQMNDATIMAIRLFTEAVNGQYLWQPGLQAGIPDRLLGRPLDYNQDMLATGSSARVLLFGRMDKYKVRLVNTLRFYRLTERYRDYDQTGFIAFLRADGDLLDAGTHPVKYHALAA